MDDETKKSMMDAAGVSAAVYGLVAKYAGMVDEGRDPSYKIETLLRMELTKAQIDETKATTELRQAQARDEVGYRAEWRAHRDFSVDQCVKQLALLVEIRDLLLKNRRGV